MGKNEWAAISRDKRIRYRPLELRALVIAKIHCFFLNRQNLTGEQQAAIVRAQIFKIARMISKYEPPCMFRLNESGVAVIEDERVPAIRRAGIKKA